MTKESDNINYTIRAGHPFPMGVTREADGINLSVQAAQTETVKFCLYKRAGRTGRRQIAEIPFPEMGRIGNLVCMKIEGLPEEFAYNFKIDDKTVTDSYAKALLGRELFGKQEKGELCALCYLDTFDWEGDRPLHIAMEDTILYRLHVRGFTKHVSSGTNARGTFAGIREKIPYLKDLGITMVELLPAYEFDEFPREQEGQMPLEQQVLPRLNYWGYSKAFYFAPKASYAEKKEAHVELKELVKELHRNGIELCMEFYFVPGTRKDFILECLRYWVLEYHVDGFHVNSDVTPLQVLAEDPLLSTTKLFATWWGGAELPRGEKGQKHLAEFHDGFLVDARRFLKGDADLLQALLYRFTLNPPDYSVVNYIANHDSLTLHDSVTYEMKHNEKNGENNRDGNQYNYSWNCGEEGESRRKKVVERREKQIRNALMLVFLSQGIPMLLAGDEFGRTKSGNSNAWCQDNEISWINWNMTKSRSALLNFTKELIAFRKAHRIFHMPQQLKHMDYGKNGYPDVSYHGTRAWYPDLDAYSRHIGIMYCGEYTKYVQEAPEYFYYVALNAHWEEHGLGLPNLPKGKHWYELATTEHGSSGFRKEKALLPNQKEYLAQPRTVTILVGC